MDIFTLRKLKLGDTWAAVSWLLQQPAGCSGQPGAALSESTRSRRRSSPVRPLVTEIAALLETDAVLRFVPGNDGERLHEDECFQHEYLPTRRRWTSDGGRTVCLQLDGRWQSHWKNPTPQERVRLIESLTSAGYEVKELGLPMRLAECVEALAACHCFIGVDSGMMHVANSVRCPRILIRNRMYKIETVYRGKSLMITANAESAAQLLCPAGSLTPAEPLSAERVY